MVVSIETRRVGSGCVSLEEQQLLLRGEAAGEACELPGRTDDPVAWHDDGEWVLAVRPSHSTRGCRSADGSGEFAVRHRLAVGNGLERAPHLELELGPAWSEWKIELGSRPREVLVELSGDPVEECGFA